MVGLAQAGVELGSLGLHAIHGVKSLGGTTGITKRLIEGVKVFCLCSRLHHQAMQGLMARGDQQSLSCRPDGGFGVVGIEGHPRQSAGCRADLHLDLRDDQLRPCP